MPTILFQHLAEEKKEKIIKASMKEFSSCPYENASINAIIKDADISRGSFYQYFNGKEDLYLYILDRGLNAAYVIFSPIIEDKTKTPNERIMCIFDKAISYGERANLFTKMMMNMKYSHHKSIIGKIKEFLDKDAKQLKSLTPDENKAFFELFVTSFGFACFSVIVEKNSYEEAKKILELKLKIIEGGMKLND